MFNGTWRLDHHHHPSPEEADDPLLALAEMNRETCRNSFESFKRSHTHTHIQCVTQYENEWKLAKKGGGVG